MSFCSAESMAKAVGFPGGTSTSRSAAKVGLWKGVVLHGGCVTGGVGKQRFHGIQVLYPLYTWSYICVLYNKYHNISFLQRCYITFCQIVPCHTHIQAMDCTHTHMIGSRITHSLTKHKPVGWPIKNKNNLQHTRPRDCMPAWSCHGCSKWIS